MSDREKGHDAELTEEELRAWFVHMARSDFSETECRSALEDCAKVLPVEFLRTEHLNLYLGMEQSRDWYQQQVQQQREQRARQSP